MSFPLHVKSHVSVASFQPMPVIKLEGKQISNPLLFNSGTSCVYDDKIRTMPSYGHHYLSVKERIGFYGSRSSIFYSSELLDVMPTHLTALSNYTR